MRDPSIHVKRSDLKWILQEFFEDLDDTDINRIMQELRKYSCDNRSVTVSNEKLRKDMDRRLVTNKGDASLLADVIYSVRIQLKHRGVRKINQDSRDWLQLKQLTKLCNQFAEEFNLEKREAYIEYIQLCMKRITSVNSLITKFISLYEPISNEFDNLNKLKKDSDPGITKEIHNYFVSKVADKTGIYNEYLSNPGKMARFMEIREICESLGVDHTVFIDAQFEALDWCNGMPSPEMMVTDKAKERLQKYMYQNQITNNQKSKKSNNDFFKKLKTL